jgi:hypothetical protein
MGFLEFAAGYALGAKAGSEGFDEVVASARAILDSREFQAFVASARTHLAHTLRELAALVAGDETEPGGEDLLDMVRGLMRRRDTGLRSVSDWIARSSPPPPGAESS